MGAFVLAVIFSNRGSLPRRASGQFPSQTTPSPSPSRMNWVRRMSLPDRRYCVSAGLGAADAPVAVIVPPVERLAARPRRFSPLTCWFCRFLAVHDQLGGVAACEYLIECAGFPAVDCQPVPLSHLDHPSCEPALVQTW